VPAWAFWAAVLLLRFLSWPLFRVRVEGREHYPEPPYVAVFNHGSNLDTVVMAWSVKHACSFMAKRELMESPFLGAFLRFVGGISVRRGGGDQEAFDRALVQLAGGLPLFIAPEGTRKHAGDGTRRPHTGFVRLARRADCPVVPVAVAGTREALPPGAWLPRPGKLRLKVGRALRLPPLDAGQEQSEPLQEQADAVMREVYRLKAEMDGESR